MSTYERVAALPLRVESVATETLRASTPAGMERLTTVVRLRGGGEEGIGEDVSYDAAHHDPYPAVAVAHDGALDAFSRSLPPLPGYARWAFESAALDLALRQSGLSLAAAVGREPQPVRFVVSSRLDPHAWLAAYPSIRFKLDASDSWTDEVVAALAATGAVDVVDLKGLYEGPWVGVTPGAALYRRVAEGFPSAWLEDPRVDDETRPVLEPHAARITWDAALHAPEDVDALPWPPRCLNSKPSRFGTVRALFAFYDLCAERGILVYGGGQWELGPGRGQVQRLASLFHPDMPNDVAPGGYNAPEILPGLPASPLPPPGPEPGFR